MAGRAPADQIDKGAIVCSCFGIGDKQIANAVESGACTTTADVGKALGAGTNCGSCRNEIDVIVRQLHKQNNVIPLQIK
jgi:assimilatory nitrate reductase catalytic subunit